MLKTRILPFIWKFINSKLAPSPVSKIKSPIFEMKQPDDGSQIIFQIDNKHNLFVIIDDGITAKQRLTTVQLFNQAEIIYCAAQFVSKNLELIEQYPISYN